MPFFSILIVLNIFLFISFSNLVSPLIALMQNQLEQLQKLGVKAEILNSSLKAKERNRINQDIDSKKPVKNPKKKSLNFFLFLFKQKNLENKNTICYS